MEDYIKTNYKQLIKREERACVAQKYQNLFFSLIATPHRRSRDKSKFGNSKIGDQPLKLQIIHIASTNC